MAEQCRATSKQTKQRCQRLCASGKTVCHYHGGARGSGAQPGNRNARIHGGYAKDLSPDEITLIESLPDDAAFFLIYFMKLCYTRAVSLRAFEMRRGLDPLTIEHTVTTRSGKDGGTTETETRRIIRIDDALVRFVSAGVRAASAPRLISAPQDPDDLFERLRRFYEQSSDVFDMDNPLPLSPLTSHDPH